MKRLVFAFAIAGLVPLTLSQQESRGPRLSTRAWRAVESIPMFVCRGAPARATAGTSEEILATCSLPAGLLRTNGMRLEVEFLATTAANANNKQVRVRVGGLAGTLVADSTAAALNDRNVITTEPVVVSRLSATTATTRSEVAHNANASAAAATVLSAYTARAAAITWANALDVVITGTTASAAGDLTLQTFSVSVHNVRQSAELISPSGSGTASTLAKWSGAAGLTNSSVTDDGNSVVIGNGLTRNIEANTAGSGAPNVLTCPTTSESFKILTNEGATAENYHTLPSAATGCTFQFYVQSANGLRVTAAAGDTIRVGTSVSATAGYVHSFVPGASLTLTAINATEWVVTDYKELWAVDGVMAELGGVPNLRRYVRLLYEDESINQGNLFATASGSGAAGVQVAPIDDIGSNMIRVTTGTTTTGRVQISPSGSGFDVAGGRTYARSVGVIVDDLSDATEAYTVWSGFNDSVTDSGVDAAACRYSHSINSGEWECYTRSNFSSSEETVCDTNIAVAADTRYSIEVALSSSAAVFAINGVAVCSITTNVPSGPTRFVVETPLQIVKAAGTTARLAYIDAYSSLQARTTPR